MANWFAKDALWADPIANRHAGNKARQDAECILERLDWRPLVVATNEVHSSNSGTLGKIAKHRHAEKAWSKALSLVSPGDVVFLQLPLVNHSIFMSSLVGKLQRKGIRFVGLVHDLESIRMLGGEKPSWFERLRINGEETSLLRRLDLIIAHNEAMSDALTRRSGVSEGKIVPLGIFDYLCDADINSTRFHKDLPMVVCGSLRKEKAGYLYNLAENIPLNLYGVGFEGGAGSNNNYCGSFEPSELVNIVEGSFGLVWDGPDASSCTGSYGTYLKVNNPHKTSMYLAAGLPVAIWGQAALAEFVISEGIGIAAESIVELEEKRLSLAETDYASMKESVARIAQRLREGRYLMCAIDKSLASLR